MKFKAVSMDQITLKDEISQVNEIIIKTPKEWRKKFQKNRF